MRAALLALLLATIPPLVSLSPTPAAAQIQRQQRDEVLRALRWSPAGSYALPLADADLTVWPGDKAVLGRDADTFAEAINGVTAQGYDAVVEARAGGVVYFQMNRSGRVTFDDWGQLNVDAMMAEMRQQMAAENPGRQARGYGYRDQLRWITPPWLDMEGRTVRWSLSFHSGGHEVVNAVVLVFGRHGYEQLTWAGRDASLDQPLRTLETVMKGFAFHQGARYQDALPEDPVAAYGAAGLVAGLLGAKVAAKALAAGAGKAAVGAAAAGAGAAAAKIGGSAAAGAGAKAAATGIAHLFSGKFWAGLIAAIGGGLAYLLRKAKGGRPKAPPGPPPPASSA